MRVLVTGGAGYIGSILVPALLDAGHEVTVYDNLMYRQPSLAAHAYHPHLELVIADIRDRAQLSSALAAADAVIPLAAIVGAPACDKDPQLATAVNRDAALWLFEALGNEQLVLMPTTNSAYGSGDENNFCDETSPLRPLSQYAREKVIVEEALLSRPNSTSFRLATVFGLSPRMRLDLLVNNFVLRALEDRFVVLFEGHFKRNYIHIRDVVAAFMMALAKPGDFVGQVFNVGLSSANLSKVELCERIARQIPDFTYLEAPLRQDPDQRNYIVSNAKIEALGFEPAFSIDTGIAELKKGLGMFHTKPYSNL